jgi:hypothetical protein
MKRHQVLFVDPHSPHPYSDLTLAREALSGVAATVVRVAEGLSRRHTVVVAQGARTQAAESPRGVRYLPLEPSAALGAQAMPSVVVLVEGPERLGGLAAAFPGARRFLWQHTFPGRTNEGLVAAATRVGATVVSVSKAHRRSLTSLFAARDPADAGLPRVLRIYDPVEDDLFPDGTPRDLDKLVTTSAPREGLVEVVEAFHFLRRRWPTMKLFRASPAWTDEDCLVDEEGVYSLGALPQHELVRHLREALCLFTPQRSFAETFGLAFAEANAVGTPVLAHPHGAAPELLSMAKEQLHEAGDLPGIAHHIERWRAGAVPVLTTHPALRLSQVTSAWEVAFDDDERLTPPERAGAPGPFSSFP